jgi:hypothetical protein
MGRHEERRARVDALARQAVRDLADQVPGAHRVLARYGPLDQLRSAAVAALTGELAALQQRGDS